MGFNAETEGRVARAEISVYDAMLAEVLGEHIAGKCRVRNRRKADRKHVAENWGQEKLNRKDRHIDYVCRDSRRKYGHGKTCYWASNAERKICKAEQVARKDWEIEQRDIEVARLDAEIMAEYAEWEARREWEDMCRKLNEWLKYA